MMLTCHLSPCNGQQWAGTTIRDWNNHERTHHGAVEQLASMDWRTRALAEVRHLAATGKPFTFYDVARVAGDPINPQSMWGTFAREVRHMGIAEPVGYQESERPETRGSAVKVWRAPSKAAAA